MDEFSASNNSILKTASKLPTFGSRLQLPSSSLKRRVALDDELENNCNKGDTTRKSARLDDLPEVVLPPQPVKKAVAIVKPATSHKSSVEMKNSQLTTKPANNKILANKLKRRSVGVLNKNNRLVAAVKCEPNRQKLATIQQSRGSAESCTLSRASSSNQIKKPSISNSINVSVTSKDDKKKAARPGWDIKGRLEDMENEMRSNKNETTSLRSRLYMLETQNVQLETTAQQRQQVSQEAFAEIDELRTKLRRKSEDFDELERKYAALLREKANLESELRNSMSKCDELAKTVAESISAQYSANVQLETLKTIIAEEKAKSEKLAEKATKFEKLSLELENDVNSMEEKSRHEEMLRRRLHNMVQELKGNIRVFCRVRPLLPNERSSTDGDATKVSHICIPAGDNTKLEISNANELNESSMQMSKTNTGTSSKRAFRHEFEFDRVFDFNADQKSVFDEISQLVQSAIDGYNVCIFAYGQTGSGKTYTMQGPELNVLAQRPETAGMIPLAVRQIFTNTEELKTKGWQYKLEASFLEIYNEKIRDLLGDGNNEEQNLDIRLVGQSAGKSSANDVVVPGLTVKIVENEQQIESLIALAVDKRAKAATKCNARSSRSHSVFRLHISGSNSITGVTCDGMLSLVDLAGSERLKESGSEGDRLKEAQNINKSLSTLGQVITCISQKDAHVPYRNSKLTFLLQSSLGGNSKTLMFVNISPNEEHMNETINSLKFASKVNQCHIGAAFKKN